MITKKKERGGNVLEKRGSTSKKRQLREIPRKKGTLGES